MSTAKKKTPAKKSSAKRPPAAAVKHIAEDLRPLAVPLDSLTPDPRNANKHDARSIEEIRKSLEAHGQQKPIVVHKQTGKVIAGNGTLEAFRAIGWEWIAVTRMEADEATAAAFGIRDNRSAQFAEWDAQELASLIEELDLDGITAEGLGFTPAELNDLVDSALAVTSVPAGGGTGTPRGKGPRSAPPADEPEPTEEAGLWHVLVFCDDADDQAAFLERMQQEERTAKALN